MPGHYDTVHVFLSLLMSLLASWAALDLSGRVSLQRTKNRRLLWVCAGALAMGIGIWSMHYVGMLAYRTPMPVLYDWPTVVVSLFAAVLASGVALVIVSRETLSWSGTVLGGVFMGGGIAAMHYIGMSAMRMPAKLSYSWSLVSLSILVAVVISMAALRLTFGSKGILVAWSGKKAASASLMGLAIPTMHYIGMMAARWTEDPSGYGSVHLAHAVPATNLGTLAIVLVTSLVVALVLVSADIDRHILRYESDLRMTAQKHDSLHQHHNVLQNAFRASGVGLWECDPATGLFYVDPCLRDMYEIEHDGLPVARDSWKKRVHPDDREALDRRWAECLAKSEKYENEYRVVRSNGKIYRYKSIATVVRSEDGTVRRVQGMTWDVTAERQREQDTAEEAERFRMTLEAIGDAVISTDENHRITFLNRAANTLTGWTLQESVGRPLEQVFVTRDEQTDAPHRNAVHRCIEGREGVLTEEAVLVSRSGERSHIKQHVALMNHGRAAVITFQDVTASRRLEKELKHSASHDSLTGLPNRTAFERKLHSLWEQSHSLSRTHCLCIVDLDRFKIINDTAGHMAGDALLKEVAKILQNNIRPSDYAARMGGDEFMLLLPDSTRAEGERCAARLLEKLSELRFPWQDRTYDVTASMGMIVFDGGSTFPEELISQADVATFTSKRGGRNRLSVYTEDEGGAAGHHHEMTIVADLRRAIEENCFELHAQPIVPTNSERAAPYFELLVRMRKRDGQLVAPALFIPAAERYGLMAMVDRWVIRNALELASPYFADDPTLSFSINLSADSLSDGSLWSFVEKQFEVTGVPAGSITFEITESGLIQNLAHAREFIRNAQSAGCKIALDDFGTGLSSLSYLKQFSLDVLKVDGSFVRQLTSNRLDQSIIKAIAEIARSMNALTVAECVEDASTIDLLQRLGVEYVQGWATGKPVPLQTVLDNVAPRRKFDVPDYPLSVAEQPLI